MEERHGQDAVDERSKRLAGLPSPGVSYRGAEGRLGYLLRQAHQAMRSRIDTIAKEHGITAPQFSTLSVLSHSDGISGAELAAQSMLRPQTVHEIIVLLEERGLVERRDNDDDRRRRDVYLTHDGREVLAVVDAEVYRLEQRILSRLGIQAARHLREGLVRCVVDS